MRSLLDSSAVAGEFLEVPAVEQFVNGAVEPIALPSRIGPWDIERELGQGGMGTSISAGGRTKNESAGPR